MMKGIGSSLVKISSTKGKIYFLLPECTKHTYFVAH